MSTELKDFPEFLGPMVVKELRQGVRGKMFVVPFIVIHVAMLLALAADLAAASVITPGPSYSLMGMLGYGLFSGVPGQVAFWQVAFLLLLVVMPWAGLSALSREREGRNGELLLMAGVSRWKIVLGKWLTLCALGSLTAMTMLPYLLVRYFIGGMNVPVTIAAALIAVTLNATANALAIGLSGYSSLGTRFWVGGMGALAFFFSGMIVVGSTMFLVSVVLGQTEAAVVVGSVAGVAAACFLYTVMGLQLGRMRIKPYERPYEEATSGGLCAFIILCPVLLGVVAVLTFGAAASVGALLMGYTVVKMDPTPKERRRAKVYPPSQAGTESV